MTNYSPRHDQPERSPGDDPDSLTLGHVLLMAGSLAGPDVGVATGGAAGEVVVPGMSLVINAVGLTLLKPGGAVGAVLPWASIEALTTDAWAVSPEGTPAVLIEATTATKAHRFLVPAGDPEELAKVIDEVGAARQAPAPARRKRRPVGLVALVVLAVVLVVVVLLVAGGKL
jgi:hypothetical protein